jgi:predicted RNA-binding Zn-ribbon protein involved in translation (DUF1610 family)
MNKYQKAIEVIDTLLHLMCGEEREDGYLPTMEEMSKSMYLLQELVERSTPKKLVATRHTRRCPSCNRQMSDINNAHPNMKFCPNCGQALDWRDEE